MLIIVARSSIVLLLKGFSNDTSNVLAGVAGGVGQGVFITPTQRLKTIIMTDTRPRTTGILSHGIAILTETLRQEGIGSLFKGLGPMMIKRGFDWGLRYQGIVISTNFLKRDDKKRNLSTLEKLCVGFFGGAFSTLTMPLDSLVANCQKSGGIGKVNALSVAATMWRTHGAPAFVRGWLMRLVHAGYHTMWMATIGQILYEKITGRKDTSIH